MAFLQSQIRPHFIYNALSVIMSLCYTDGPKAGRLLAEFSNYLRLSFDIDNNDSLVSLEKELSLVHSYVEIEKARFGERLSVEYNIETGITECRILPLIIQPLVENAIRHGLMKRVSGGKVAVWAKAAEGMIILMVKDNGTGIPKDMLEQILKMHNESGVGLKNIQRRLLNLYGQTLEIKSSEAEGTEVTVKIPYSLK